MDLPFAYDFERIVDDFVFMSLLLGNDFLPHLPSIKIREGAFDAILYLYKMLLPSFDGYLTNQGQINFANADKLFKLISLMEEE